MMEYRRKVISPLLLLTFFLFAALEVFPGVASTHKRASQTDETVYVKKNGSDYSYTWDRTDELHRPVEIRNVYVFDIPPGHTYTSLKVGVSGQLGKNDPPIDVYIGDPVSGPDTDYVEFRLLGAMSKEVTYRSWDAPLSAISGRNKVYLAVEIHDNQSMQVFNVDYVDATLTYLPPSTTTQATTTTTSQQTTTTLLPTTTITGPSTTQPGGGGTTTAIAPTTSTTVAGTTTTTLLKVTFKDVSTGDWFYSYVVSLVSKGVISGYPDNTFRPQNNISRAEFAKMIILATGEQPSSAPSSLTDVPNSYWAKGYIQRAKEISIITGYPDNTFKPLNNITRQEIAATVVRAGKFPPVTTYTPDFSDVPSSLWSWPYILEAEKLGIVSGYSDNTFRPSNPATRAEASKMVVGMLNNIGRAGIFSFKLSDPK